MLRATASNRRIVLWNAAGSAVYALSSFLLLIIVIRTCGEVEGGVFSIGYAIAQLMLTVGVFESTTYFATDAGNRFTYAQYLAFKIATCALMVAASIGYVLSFGFDAHKAAVAYALSPSPVRGAGAILVCRLPERGAARLGRLFHRVALGAFHRGVRGVLVPPDVVAAWWRPRWWKPSG